MTTPRRKDRYEGYFDQYEHALRGSSLAHVANMICADLHNAEMLNDLPALPVSADLATMPPADAA